MSSSTTTDPQNELIDTYLRHWKLLRSFLKRQTGSHELAEDALQETWLRLAKMTGPIDAIKDRQAFILRVAGNIAIDLARRENRHSSRCISDEVVLGAVADACPSPETVAIDRDRLRALVKALAQLPVKPRSALLMSRCDGFTHAQIAAQLKVSESMVARYLVRALRHCRDHLRDDL